jgi:predicted nucleic acid-binding protein
LEPILGSQHRTLETRKKPMKLIDSSAWTEYFIGSKRGFKVKDYVEGDEPLYTPSICSTEIKSRHLTDQTDPTTRINLIIERSFIIQLDKEIALLAANVKEKHKLHAVDAITYATSQHKNITLITGDLHFKDLPNVTTI